MADNPKVDHRDESGFTEDITDFIEKMFPDRDYDKMDPQVLEDFLYEDGAEKIYVFLTEKFRHYGFCDFLKRHIHRETRMTGPISSVPDEEYLNIILDAFRDNAAEFSFYPTKAHSRDIVRTWLRRKVVSRETVMLIGFGLKMTLDGVNEMLHKALHEPFLDPKEPLEAVCAYCFRYGYSFQRFRKIWNRFDPDHPVFVVSGKEMGSTSQFLEKLEAVDNDDDMLNYLYSLPLFKGSKRQSVTARGQFDRLYESVIEGLARRQERDEVAETESPDEREEAAGGSGADAGTRTGNAEIENVLYAFVPRTRDNNYAPMRQSTLKDLFYEKRLNRQHIGNIQAGKDPVTRFDLITMCFLNYDLQRDNRANEAGVHYDAFVRETNKVLKACNMDGLYPVNPYECFIMLCMRTESPLEVYSAVWGMSYGEEV